MLNLYHLEMFLAVVDTGSFSAAAESLHLTQPAVSEGVKALEGKLDIRLFDRRGRRAAVTPEGAALIDHARRLLALAAEAEAAARQRDGVIRGVLRLATATSAGAAWLAARVGAFTAAHPETRCALVPGLPAALLDGLRDGEIDCAFFAERPGGDRLTSALVATDEWALVAPPGHAWLSGLPSEPRPALKRPRGRPPRRLNAPSAPATAEIDLADLTDERVVLLGADGPLGQEARRELRALLSGRGVALAALRVAVEAPDFAGALRAVEEGAGVGLLPLALLDGYRGAAVAFRVAEAPLERRLYAVRDSRFAGAGAGAAWWAFLTGDAAPPPDDDPA
jgi:DNA-binding transcriptional LysR family regulator